MKISNAVLMLTNKLKPVLLKIFPYEFLKKIKGKIIKKSYSKIIKTEIEPFKRDRFLDGINLVGNIKAETGLGQSCRLIADELKAAGIPFSIFQYEQLGVMTEGIYDDYNDKISEELPYNVNLIHINPHELGLAFQQSHEIIWNGRYNIGFWLWELEEFPEEWVPCFHCLNEIWTPSEFISTSIRKKTELPVVTIPYHVSVDIPEKSKVECRGNFQLPKDKFLFLMMYDRTSMTERKNPKGVLDAYKKAFESYKYADDIGLVIKINNSTVQEINMIKSLMPKFCNVYFITEILERQKVNELIYCADAVISLHRAEGFGLVLAEAMYLGIPTIATNWSSNTEFMASDVAYMVDVDLVEITEDIGSFKKGNHWAEPDTAKAADCMRLVYEDCTQRQIIAQNAAQYIRTYLSMEQAVSKIKVRFDMIYESI